MNIFWFTLSISLFDSLSTTLQIVAFVLLLATVNPMRNALAYLIGLSAAYFGCGIVGYLAIDRLRLLLNKLVPSEASVSNPAYYLSELLMGLIMVGIGLWYFYKGNKAKHGQVVGKIISKLKTMTAFFAFCIGAFISVTSFPASIPYMIALNKYAALHLGPPALLGLILVYNIGYSLPMVLILLLYLFVRRKTVPDHEGLHASANRLNVHLTTWTFAGFGLFSIVDAGWFFLFGHALIKGRYF